MLRLYKTHMSKCEICKQEIIIDSQARDLLDRFKVPDPKLCYKHRLMRRHAFRNERILYKRKCDLTGKNTISIFAPDRPFKVFSQDAWWSDKWAPPEAEFDFKRPFFEQFRELQLKAPRMALLAKDSENSEYANHSQRLKDCYLCFSVVDSEKVFYGMMCDHASDCVDVSYCYENCELCVNAFYCNACFGSAYITECRGCTDVWFSYDCSGCTNCFLCWNLRNKQYCFMNEQLTKDEYEKKIAKYRPLNKKDELELINKWEDIKKNKAIHQNSRQINCENSTGDYLTNCTNCHNCFHQRDAENCQNFFHAWGNKESMDIINTAYCEFCYEMSGVVSNNYCKFINYSYDNNFLEYCDHVYDSEHCFGCVGLKKGKYYILNKPYKKEEYEKLKERIIEHMKKTGEYGEFFPFSCSPFAYNETIANEMFPLKKEEALKLGCEWRDEEKEIPNIPNSVPARDLPENIKETKDDILDQTILCEKSGKPYKIMREELEIYRRLNLPIPHESPEIRYKNQLKQRTSIQLFDKKCDKCGKDIKTTYDPKEGVKNIYCAECYKNEIY